MAASSADDAAMPRLYSAAFVALAGGAWVALGWLRASPWAPYFSHAATEDGAPLGVRAGLFVVGWILMSVAMMLPTSLPLVTVFRTITSGAGWLVALLAAGYLAVWALFGATAWLADVGLHELVDASASLQARAHLIPAGLVLAAGLFQFSPLKYTCLTQCRSPVGFIIRHWQGGSRARRAVTLGIWHGVYCVGCCWVLMLLMFGVGGIHLGWMLALSAVMFVEKAVSWGRWDTAPIGGLLALWGFALLAGVPGVPTPF